MKNSLKRIISDLELYDKNRENLDSEKKILNRLYKNFELSKMLNGQFIISSGGNNEKTFFNFKKEGGKLLYQAYFWKLSNNKPYQFQINNLRDKGLYSSKKMVPPDKTPETRRDNLNKCIKVLEEFCEFI